MGFSIKVEEISTTTAHEYLALSGGNRTLRTDYVLSLAVAMESGKWDENASELVFDEDGVLIDGHHRLNAIILFGKPVRMLVKRGVAKSARSIIDTGGSRNIRDLFTMFRSGTTYVTQRKAALTTCISLIVIGKQPAIKTLDSYDSWMRQFKEGIDTCVELAYAGGNTRHPIRLGPVTGAFAFAHKTHPKLVEAFMVKVRDGIGLQAREPAHTLLTLLQQPQAAVRGHQRADRYLLSRKVLQALHADIKGHMYAKAQAGDAGMEYFRKAYDGAAITKLLRLWTPDAESES